MGVEAVCLHPDLQPVQPAHDVVRVVVNLGNLQDIVDGSFLVDAIFLVKVDGRGGGALVVRHAAAVGGGKYTGLVAPLALRVVDVDQRAVPVDLLPVDGLLLRRVDVVLPGVLVVLGGARVVPLLALLGLLLLVVVLEVEISLAGCGAFLGQDGSKRRVSVMGKL